MGSRLLKYTCLTIFTIAGIACTPAADEAVQSAGAAYTPPPVTPESRNLDQSDIERMMEELSNWGAGEPMTNSVLQILSLLPNGSRR